MVRPVRAFVEIRNEEISFDEYGCIAALRKKDYEEDVPVVVVPEGVYEEMRALLKDSLGEITGNQFRADISKVLADSEVV